MNPVLLVLTAPLRLVIGLVVALLFLATGVFTQAFNPREDLGWSEGLRCVFGDVVRWTLGRQAGLFG